MKISKEVKLELIWPPHGLIKSLDQIFNHFKYLKIKNISFPMKFFLEKFDLKDFLVKITQIIELRCALIWLKLVVSLFTKKD
jgi:hypothetical protein